MMASISTAFAGLSSTQGTRLWMTSALLNIGTPGLAACSSCGICTGCAVLKASAGGLRTPMCSGNSKAKVEPTPARLSTDRLLPICVGSVAIVG